MRIGFNPQKDKQLAPSEFFHQVVIPVYIPHQEGYFKDSFTILKYCLESLFKTCHDKTYVTVVNNGSCKEVVDYLNALYYQKKIHELVHTTNIGKLNAVLKGLSGQNFPLLTITDADVLFLNGWQEATYNVYTAFPKAGVVGPVPNSKMLRYFSGNIYFDQLFSKSLQFSKVINPKAMKEFAISVGTPELFNSSHLDKYLTLSSNTVKVVVGSGHFVATYNRRIFDRNIENHSIFKMGSELSKFLDIKALKLDLWRLSTEENFAFHMGNVKEEWMTATLQGLHDNKESVSAPQLKPITNSKLGTWFKTEVFSRIIFRAPIWRLFLRYKGLSKEEANTY
ncbi:hypothetical protein FSS13T_22290 [Flavobacterium saliperosum S13]|nr:glycosyltransferase family A protein [Flavobacterium saliperosum]ESU23921.1 hypothetical protein FSS13T_22290 [Flavobacterium saliperosum S13]